MATPLCYPITQIGSNTLASAITLTITAGSTATFVAGINNLVRVCSDTAVNLRFGATGLTTATANDVYLPSNFPEIHDMGTNFTTIAIFNGTAGSAKVNLAIISRT